jgi:hypothetical protein
MRAFVAAVRAAGSMSGDGCEKVLTGLSDAQETGGRTRTCWRRYLAKHT